MKRPVKRRGLKKATSRDTKAKFSANGPDYDPETMAYELRRNELFWRMVTQDGIRLSPDLEEGVVDAAYFLKEFIENSLKGHSKDAVPQAVVDGEFDYGLAYRLVFHAVAQQILEQPY